MLSFPPEEPLGNIEYKFHLLDRSEEKRQNRVTQLLYRLEQGKREAYYYLGILDNGTIRGISKEDLDNSKMELETMAISLHCVVYTIFERPMSERWYAAYLVRERTNDTYADIKYGIVGNVDSGKSTTIGTLTKGLADDGRGKMRSTVFNFKHELVSGRTSSIGHEIIGFDDQGRLLNSFRRDWASIVRQSQKIVSFFDLAGHERYLKTTIYGLTSMHPDYCLVMIGANMGLSFMTIEHIRICVSLQIPFLVLITKVDISPASILMETLQHTKSFLKGTVKKIPFLVKNEEDVLNVVLKMGSGTIVPVLQISNVTRYNFSLLETILYLLPPRKDYSQKKHLPCKMLIDRTYAVIGHGLILCGFLKEGSLHVHDSVYLGPHSSGDYHLLKIKSIQQNCIDLKRATCGHYLTIGVKGIARKEVKKGMILFGDKRQCMSYQTFWASITILQSHTTTIRRGYQPIVHIENIRRAVILRSIDRIHSNTETTESEVLRTGDRAHVFLEFIGSPQYIEPFQKIIFREGQVKAVGNILEKTFQ